MSFLITKKFHNQPYVSMSLDPKAVKVDYLGELRDVQKEPVFVYQVTRIIPEPQTTEQNTPKSKRAK